MVRRLTGSVQVRPPKGRRHAVRPPAQSAHGRGCALEACASVRASTRASSVRTRPCSSPGVSAHRHPAHQRSSGPAPAGSLQGPHAVRRPVPAARELLLPWCPGHPSCLHTTLGADLLFELSTKLCNLVFILCNTLLSNCIAFLSVSPLIKPSDLSAECSRFKLIGRGRSILSSRFQD